MDRDILDQTAKYFLGGSMVSTTNVVCECGHEDCGLSIRLTVDQVQEITSIAGSIVILDDCINGPQANDSLSSEGDGFTVYIRA